ncbi:MAG: hypothetical protein HQM14_14025 [SAR324 cluster bacterium]|nr:hypothetical protein [SAR324 cluster bacterium]
MESNSENRRVGEDANLELSATSMEEGYHKSGDGPFGGMGEGPFSVPSPEGSSYRMQFVKPLLQYFTELEQQLMDELSNPEAMGNDDLDDEEFSDIVASDKLQFDEHSINAALALCRDLEKYIQTQLSDDQFTEIQSTYLFYESPQQLLDMIKLLFIGDLRAKEKVVRIYGAKMFGTYKVVQMILNTTGIFEDMEEIAEKEAKESLLKYAENPLREFKKFFKPSLQTQIPSTGLELATKVRETLASKAPLFDETNDYNQILEVFRNFILCLYADLFVLQYLEWKEKYLRYWIYQELYRLDIQNMTGETKIPQYSFIKTRVYQQLDNVFSNLDRVERIFDKSLLLKKNHYRAMGHGEAFLPEGEEADKTALMKARDSEAVLLNSLNRAQINSIAERLHIEIAQTRKDKKLRGKPPANANMRSTDIGAEKKADQKYVAAAVKAQVTEAKKKDKPPAAQFFKAMGKMVQNLRIGVKKKEQGSDAESAVPEAPPEPEIPPRAEGNLEGPLDPVDVDWVGYGKEFKSTVYERTYPNLQQRFFDHGGLRLRMNDDFLVLVDTIIQYYGELGYLKKRVHKMGVKDGIKEFLDEAVYLRTGPDIFLAVGRSPFSRDGKPTPYVQIFRTNPLQAQKGSLKNIDFSKMVDNEKYELEHIENSNELRPILFTNLIKILDSLPDDLRDPYKNMLKAMHGFLSNQPEAAS